MVRKEIISVRWIMSVLLLLAMGAALAACGGRLSAPKEPIMTVYADGTKGCKQEPYPVMLWDRAGAGSARGKSIAEIPHGTKLEVYRVKEHFGVKYYEVIYKGQRGWVADLFTSETEPKCP